MEKIAFVFPGQGSQYIGMMKTLCEQHDVARYTFEEASDILGYDILRLCFEGRLSELSSMQNMQIAILTASTAVFRVYMKEIGIPPKLCAGHSLGEYSALVSSGVIEFSDCLQIISKRSKIAQKIIDLEIGTMTVAEGIAASIVEEECLKASSKTGQVAVSCYNSSNQVNISGNCENVAKVETALVDMGVNVTPLIISPPFHCKLMESYSDVLKEELQKYTFHNFKWPVISNVTGLPYRGRDSVVDLLEKQLYCPVKWTATMDYMQKAGITYVVEIGPRSILCNLIRADKRPMKTMSFDSREDRSEMERYFKGNTQYTSYSTDIITACITAAVGTKNYNDDPDAYAKGVIEPYKKLQEISNDLSRSGKCPDDNQIKRALELLKIILNTKKLSENEQNECINNIYESTGTVNHMFM